MGLWVNTGMRVLVGVGLFVMVGVAVALGVSVYGIGVNVDVAARKADVCIADQVFAAAVSGNPGSVDTVREPMLQAVDTNNARRIRKMKCR